MVKLDSYNNYAGGKVFLTVFATYCPASVVFLFQFFSPFYFL